MKLKELQSLLQDVQPFSEAKVELEQYPTGAHLAACMLYTIDNAYDDLQGKTVIDLGSGTGMLSIGSALLGASHVLGLEIDPDGLQVAQENVEQFEEPLPIDFINCDLLQLVPQEWVAGVVGAESSSRQGRKGSKGGKGKGSRGVQQRHRKGGKHKTTRYQQSEDEEEGEEEEDEGEERSGDEEGEGKDEDPSNQLSEGMSHLSVQGSLPAEQASLAPTTRYTCQPCAVAVLQHLTADTVVMNPPFGTKAAGIDMMFLKAAFQMCTGCVYSLHKSSTRQHIHTVATKQLGAVSAEVVAELKYDLPATMKFHKRKSVDIEVDLWRFQVPVSATSISV